MSKVVIAVAGDAGGAVAVAPVLQQLARDARMEIRAFGYRQAITTWRTRQIPFQELPESLTEADVDNIFLDLRPSALLCGTSMNGIDLERVFIRAARSAGVGSVAVLDMWSNYSGRFGATRGAGRDVPDRIAVMDEAAQATMLGEGFAAARLVVTGHPGFDDLVSEHRAFTSRQRFEVRQRLGAAPSERLVIFASQPLSQFWGSDATRVGHPGYTEETVLAIVPDALETAARRANVQIAAILRPHPREVPPAAPWSSPRVRWAVAQAGTSREVAMSADAVVGMCTMLLVESAHLGIPTVSVQPGLRGPDVIPKVAGLVRIYDSKGAGLVAALADALSRAPAVSAHLSSHVQATGAAALQVAALVYQLA